MTVRVVAGEESVFAPGRAEQGAAYAAEGEGAGRVGVWRWRGFESALELRDALAEGVVGKVQEPADFLARVTAEGEESGDAQGGRKVGDGDVPLRLAASRRSTSPVLRTREESFFPVAFAAAAARAGAGVEGGAIADDAGQPAARFGRGEVCAAGFEGGEQGGLHEIIGLVRSARGAAGECVKVCEGARTRHSGMLARMKPGSKRARVTIG